MRHRYLAFLIGALSSVLGLRAQNVSDLIISELLPEGDSLTIVDGFGRRGGWIEVFNTSQGTVNFGGCFLSDDRGNLKKNLIPKGDLQTKIGPRQAAILYGSGKGEQGSFYVNFKIERGKTIYLTSNDGRTIIDSLSVPSDLPIGKSVGKNALDVRQMEWKVAQDYLTPTPGIPNLDTNAESKSQKMAREDPHGWILTVVSVSVVFCALAILWFLFDLLFGRQAKKSSKPQQGKTGRKGKSGDIDPGVAAAIALALEYETSSGDIAAIATALHLYLSETAHDSESYILTIRPQQSAWNDKSANFRKSVRIKSK